MEARMSDESKQVMIIMGGLVLLCAIVAYFGSSCEAERARTRQQILASCLKVGKTVAECRMLERAW